MRIFGNSTQFGIRYQPSIDNEDSKLPCCCHLVLGNEIIGNKEELCYLPTWWSSLIQIREQVEIIINNPREEIFMDYNDREVFELIFKSNQLIEDYKDEFKYLPEMADNKLWVKHHLSIDETTDGYLIVMIKTQDKLKFIWKKWREPFSENANRNLNSIVVDPSLVLNTIDEVSSFLKTTYNKILAN